MAKAAFWVTIDAQSRKRGEQTGLDTLVVHALNDGYQMQDSNILYRSKRDKYPAWGVRSQE